MWIARDKSGELWLYGVKPSRYEDLGTWYFIDEDAPYMELDNTLFPELKWENNPMEVKLIKIEL